MTVGQLSLDIATPTSEPPPERRIAQAAHSDLAAMISAVVGSIPMTGHRKGTTRETVQRPMAYLYACRERLDEPLRSIAIGVCSHVTGIHPLRIEATLGPRRVGSDGHGKMSPLWLRMNGERARTRLGATNARDPWRTMDGPPETGGWAWALHLAQRSGGTPWRARFQAAQGDLREVAPAMEGTLAGWLLALHWSPALATLVKWRRRNGCEIGDEMLVRRDKAMAVGHLPPELETETYKLCRLSPATSQLARAIMAVEPREDGDA